MENHHTTLELPCPSCATFSLVDQQLLVCQRCGYHTRKLPLKTALDYAEYVYRYGHQYRTAYESQLQTGDETVPISAIPKPPPLYTYISLALLSGVIGTTAWFLVKAAVTKLIDSYNERYQSEFEVTRDELQEINKNLREFTNSFADVNPSIRNSVFEAIFAHECNKKEAEKLLKMRVKAKSAKGPQKMELEIQAEIFLESMMRSTFKKVSKRPKPTPEEVSSYWHKVFDEPSK